MASLLQRLLKKKKQKKNKRWLSFEPLRNPGFLVFIFSGILAEMALNVPFIYLPDMMVNKGYSTQSAAMAITVIGKSVNYVGIWIDSENLYCNKITYTCSLIHCSWFSNNVGTKFLKTNKKHVSKLLIICVLDCLHTWPFCISLCWVIFASRQAY